MAEKVTYILPVIQEEDNIHIDPASVSCTIYVTGFQAGTKPEELIIHFQRRKNGGGDIVGIVISSWQRAAAITFDSPEGKIYACIWLPRCREGIHIYVYMFI